MIKVKTHDLKILAENGFQGADAEKYRNFDEKLRLLDDQIRMPNKSGAINVSNLVEIQSGNIERLKPTGFIISQNITPSRPIVLAPESSCPLCEICKERVYCRNSNIASMLKEGFANPQQIAGPRFQH